MLGENNTKVTKEIQQTVIKGLTSKGNKRNNDMC
jgi:hypothetical protein